MFGDVTRVGANFHAMEAWSNLKKVNGSIGQIQSRLSSGKRINSAEDDTSGYALSKHLESRTRGLSQALDNVGTAKNVLNIAEGGFQSQMTILQTVKEKLTQAADGSLSDAQRGAIGDQINVLLTEFDDINSDTKFNDNALMGGGDGNSDASIQFHVGEGNGDTLTVTFDNSYRRDVGESSTAVDLDDIVDGTGGTSNSAALTTAWAALDQTEATAGIAIADSAIKALAKSIQNVGDYNARFSSKEESLSLAVSNTEATRSRIEDADFAKEQMAMMKLQILQQTSMSSFSQANSAPQMVLSLFR
ncbi:MAG: flagellin [Candidatus Marinimicrobia bacterium]|nr:flagellin [Candidatus Neomarinimicrobiota bacterium]